MSHRRLWVAAAIIAAFVVVSFLFSVPRAGDVPLESTLLTKEVASVPSVALHDAFRKGTHTITGTVEAPDACSSISAEALLVGGATIQVVITLVPDEGVCLELPTRMNFSAMIDAPEGLPLSATVNGAPAETTPL